MATAFVQKTIFKIKKPFFPKTEDETFLDILEGIFGHYHNLTILLAFYKKSI
jgi:hypothetical protein